MERVPPRRPHARVIIVERHSAVRISICALVREALAGCRLIEADDDENAIQAAALARPDAVIVGLEPATGGSMRVLARLGEAMRGVPLIALSGIGDEWHRKAALDAGASAFVLKRRIVVDLVPALRRVLLAVDA